MRSLVFRSQDTERGQKEMGMGRRGTSKSSIVSIVSRIWAERSHGLLYTEGADGERNGEWEGKARKRMGVRVPGPGLCASPGPSAWRKYGGSKFQGARSKSTLVPV